jgi:hypothetical protein
MQYEQHDRDGQPIKCANGSDAQPCYRRPELTLRETNGRWLGTICGPCAADLIDARKARRSTENAFRIVLL